MEKPQVSVIVPVYKTEKYLDVCVESILAQRGPSLELILVDDGSPDGSGALCDAWAEKDARVRVVHKENGGLSSARNAGLDIMRGEYVLFVDSDDWILPGLLQKTYDLVLQHGVDMVIFSFAYYIDEHTLEAADDSPWQCEGLYKSKKVLSFFTHNASELVSACMKLYRAVLWKTRRFPVGRIHEDEFVAHRVIGDAEAVYLLPEPLYCHRQNPVSIMHTLGGVGSLDALDSFYDRVQYLQQQGLEEAAGMQAVFFLRHFIYRFIDFIPHTAAEQARSDDVYRLFLRFYPALRKYRRLMTRSERCALVLLRYLPAATVFVVRRLRRIRQVRAGN